jgi:hypothetical protein
LAPYLRGHSPQELKALYRVATRVDRNDLTCFDTLFAHGDPAADCNQDGGLSMAEQTCFKEAFERGCSTKPKPKGSAPR